MASTIIHYAISKSISEAINVPDPERFLFGATLVPDASSHDDGSYDRAHFQDWSSDCLRKGINWNLFTQKYRDSFETDSIYLGYWCHLVQDSMWLHDVVDKHIRVLPREIRKSYYQKGYDDYIRLNHLIAKEYHLFPPSFSRLDIPITEVNADVIQARLHAFYKQFDSAACRKSDLEIYRWDIVTEYIEKCVRFSLHEITAMKTDSSKIDPSIYFVTA